MTARNTTNVARLRLPLFRSEPHPCPYLPGRTAQDVFTAEFDLSPALFGGLLERGFRRSGDVIYRPDCSGCRACISLRVPVAEFRPSRSQRRALRRNADVRVETGTPASTDEKWSAFAAYLRYQHDGSMSDARDDFDRFLYESPTESLEMVYRVGRRLAGVGLVDLASNAMSSVYFYFHPDFARRSLGVFGAIREIEECRRRGLDHWYVGYYVQDCSKMRYKADFRPFEMLGDGGRWVRFENETAAHSLVEGRIDGMGEPLNGTR